MFPPFNDALAKKHCQTLIKNLDTFKRLDFEIEESKANSDFSTKWLFNQKPNGQTRAIIGQMFGVLVCADPNKKFSSSGENVILKAFSGQFNSHWNVPGWVPPLLDTKEFEKITKESDKKIHDLSNKIEKINEKILELENILKTAPFSFPHSFPQIEKIEKNEKNEQLEKLKILRIQKSQLQIERKKLSQKSMKEIFSLYKIHTSYGKVLNFCDIFTETQPATGWGECCAPKLLNYAYKNGLIPLSMAEFFYGAEPVSLLKRHKQFYPPCDEKCALILPHILGLNILYQDEEIVIINKPSGLLSIPGRGEDKADSVTARLKNIFPNCIAQPSVHRLDMDTSGLLVLALTEQSHRNLSIQFMNGTVKKRYIAVLRGEIFKNNANCGKLVEKTEFFEENCGKLENFKDFSPFKTLRAFKNRTNLENLFLLNQCFNQNAKMCNIFTQFDKFNFPISGRICLKFRLDVENRPHQIFDPIFGKIGITDWKIVPAYFEKFYLKSFNLTKKQSELLKNTPHTFIEFIPHTGRTHQLRLHSASEYGLKAAIIGDNLYGEQKENERLMLNAVDLEFFHPKTNKKMKFSIL